jgi:predicted nucleic acid-binding Zn ribbon protein
VDRGPQPIGSALDDVLQGLAPPTRPLPSAATWGTVFSRWEEVVGPAVARHARPLRLEAGVLVVAVDQPPWATQVRTLGPRILAGITELTGEPLAHMEVVVRR